MSSAATLELSEIAGSQTFWVVASLVAFLSLLVARLVHNALPGKTPPVMEGIPFVGGCLKFLGGPLKLLAEGYAKHGEVFTVPVFHKRITVLIGPNVTPHFFKASDEVMSQKEVYEFNVPIFGPGVVYDVDTKIRNEQYKMFASALKTQKLKEYLPLMCKEATEFFQKYKQEGDVDLGVAMGELVTLTASRALLGREIRENMFEEVSSLLHDLDEGMMPISVFFPYLPIPAHKRRDAARIKLAETFTKVLRGRRESGNREPDLLQHFMDSKYEKCYNGRALTDGEIGGLLIAALFGGQHTSSITAAWTGYNLIQHKQWWSKVVEEQRKVIAEFGDTMDYEALNAMPVLHGCIREALRINPPLMMILRYNRSDFTVTTRTGKEVLIPKGHILATSPTFTHRLADIYKNPETFEPDRFEPPREEDTKQAFSNISFGGGRHSCMGYNFAFLQIKVIWSTILRNFEMELVDDFPEPNYDAMVVGPKPCKVHYKRRSQPLA